MQPEERNWKLRIEDMLECAEKISRYIDEMSFDEFVDSDITIDAVMRNLEIVGEAAGYVPDEIKLAYPDVPWRGMRGMRNILIHVYDAVELDVIWETCQSRLPASVPTLRRILEQHRS
jgi:uncharacterized protein with HEPN domain